MTHRSAVRFCKKRVEEHAVRRVLPVVDQEVGACRTTSGLPYLLMDAAADPMLLDHLSSSMNAAGDLTRLPGLSPLPMSDALGLTG